METETKKLLAKIEKETEYIFDHNKISVESFIHSALCEAYRKGMVKGAEICGVV